MKKITYLIFTSLFIVSCSNNSEDDLTVPVTLGITKYNQNVKIIIDNNCLNCHGTIPSNGAPMPLVTFSQVKEAVQNRGLLDRISRDQGASGMMPNLGTRLPQNSIDLIIDWNTDGLME